MTATAKKITWVFIFAISMGYLESSVVIYLREAFYKEGFSFPLKPVPFNLSIVELFREAAAIFMLIGFAYQCGINKLQRFAYFILAFAIWDIFYYVFLYVFVDWPTSLFTWDILFLIPFLWVGPVWSPCLLCLLMIFGSLFVIFQIQKDPSFSVSKKYWTILITGSAICILAFLWDYLMFHFARHPWGVFTSEELFADLSIYAPTSFNHFLFFTGFLMMTYPVLMTYKSTLKLKHQ